MMRDLHIIISETESDALSILARSQLREDEEQVRWLIIERLCDLGLLPSPFDPYLAVQQDCGILDK